MNYDKSNVTQSWIFSSEYGDFSLSREAGDGGGIRNLKEGPD